jgi:hypothetical protein
MGPSTRPAFHDVLAAELICLVRDYSMPHQLTSFARSCRWALELITYCTMCRQGQQLQHEQGFQRDSGIRIRYESSHIQVMDA